MAETIMMPKLGFDMAEGTLVRWLKKVGEPVAKGEVLAEIETDKATVEVESVAAGVVLQLLVDEGTSVPVNNPICVIGGEGEKVIDSAGGKPVPAAKAEAVPSVEKKKTGELLDKVTPALPTSGTRAMVSPLARKMAGERGLNLGTIVGSGPGGRIVRKDVEAAFSHEVTKQPVSAAVVAPMAEGVLVEKTFAMSRLRQAIARRMGEAKANIPHFYVTHEYKMDAMLALRRQLNNALPEDEKVSVNDLLVRALGLTLQKFPNLNASLSGTNVIWHGAVNIGVAVAVEGGLLTIVCRDADRKSVRQIAGEVKAMAGRARDGKVRPEEIEGATFSISNLGMYDVDEFSAIINPPEGAILAVGSAKEVPVVEDGRVVVGWRMKATLSVNHRLSDGVEAAKFLQGLAIFVEEPVRLLL